MKSLQYSRRSASARDLSRSPLRNNPQIFDDFDQIARENNETLDN